MLRTVLLILMLLMRVQAGAQNQVPNAGFERYSTCPDNISQLTIHCEDWWSFTQASPDYFNGCNTGNVISVPKNFSGNQDAANGQAYAGIFCYDENDYREYLATHITPTIAGGVYEVSMYVSLSDYSKSVSDGIGVFFYKKRANDTVMGNTVQYVIPQVSFTDYGPITEKDEWVRLSGMFTADSAYSNMVIGSFLDNNHTNYINKTGSAYYYVDSVVVVLKALVQLNYTKTDYCGGDTLRMAFTTNTRFGSQNSFRLELSDVNGKFDKPVALGSVTTDTSGIITGVLPDNIKEGTAYRLRLVSTAPAYVLPNSAPNLHLTPAPQMSVSANNIVCAGTPIVFAATAIDGVSFSWTGPSSFTSAIAAPVIENPVKDNSGDYVVMAQLGKCTERDTVHVLVHPRPAIWSADSNSPLGIGDTLKLFVTASEPCTFNWKGPFGFNSPVSNPVIPDATINATGVYMVTAAIDSCVSDTASVSVLVGVGRRRFLVFPNPGNGRFRILGTTMADRVDIAVSNMAGQVFYKTSVLPLKGIADITLPGDLELAAGVYFINIRGKELDQQVKVVVQ